MKQFIAKGILRLFKELGLLNYLPDKIYLRLLYRRVLNRRLDLKNPITYNAKLQYLKLYDRKDIYTKLVDKYEVKKYVAELIGEEYIIPTLGVWNQFDEIDFSSLPNQFVLKCTHDSGGLIVCKDKYNIDIKAARDKINKSLGINYYYKGREWPYKNVPPRIIAEYYMEDSFSGDLVDYKFHCFDGEVKALFIATERQSGGVKLDYFDKDFVHLPFNCTGYQNTDNQIEKPKKYSEMLKIAQTLSEGFPHVRVDLYNVNDSIYFGELTFYDGSGFSPFEPEEWDYIFGSWIQLPNM